MDKVLLFKEFTNRFTNLNKITAGKNHDYNLFEHLIHTWEYLDSVVDKSNDNLKIAGLLHDIGKKYTIKFDENNNPTFHKHEIVGSEIAYDFCLTNLQLSNKNSKYISRLVREHMFRFPNLTKQSRIKTWIHTLTKEMWNNLILLRIADRKANKSKRNLPDLSKETQELINKVNEWRNAEDLIFSDDLALNKYEIIKLIGYGWEYKEIYNNLFDYINQNKLLNTKEKLSEYVRSVYGTTKKKKICDA